MSGSGDNAKPSAAAAGECPQCKEHVSDWLPPRGLYLIEASEALRKKGIDPYTGHRLDCPLRSKQSR